MGAKLEVVLYWAERAAAVVSIAVPAIREIVSVLDPKSEVVLISND